MQKPFVISTKKKKQKTKKVSKWLHEMKQIKFIETIRCEGHPIDQSSLKIGCQLMNNISNTSHSGCFNTRRRVRQTKIFANIPRRFTVSTLLFGRQRKIDTISVNKCRCYSGIFIRLQSDVSRFK